MVAANSINESTTGICGFTGTAFTATAATNHALIVGGSTSSTLSNVGPTATAGQVLQSAGSSADPAFSTATFPATATGTGTLLRADGTNWAATTSTYPNTNAASTLLYASSTNVMAALPTANNSALVTDASGVPSLGTSLTNDFTYTSSTAGTTRTLTTSNTNNSNTASQALIQTTTGGASAGDPFHTFTITGATSFSLGLDNSASDAFVIAASTALGTTNVMSVATSGEINYPLQPAFLATHTVAQDNSTGAGTSVTVNFTTEVFDQNSDYDGTNLFTAPVTGRYCFSASARVSGLTVAMTAGQLTITTSNRGFTSNVYNYGAVASAAGVTVFSVNIIVDMDAADTCDVTQLVSNGAGDTADLPSSAGGTYFSGYLIC